MSLRMREKKRAARTRNRKGGEEWWRPSYGEGIHKFGQLALLAMVAPHGGDSRYAEGKKRIFEFLTRDRERVRDLRSEAACAEKVSNLGEYLNPFCDAVEGEEMEIEYKKMHFSSPSSARVCMSQTFERR